MEPHSIGGVSRNERFTSQWEAPILVRAGWALFFSLVFLISVEKGKQRYNKTTEGNQQADYPYKYQNDIRSCHWRHLPSYVFRQAGHWLGRLPPLSWVPRMDSTIIRQEFQQHPFWGNKSTNLIFQHHINIMRQNKRPKIPYFAGFPVKMSSIRTRFRQLYIVSNWIIDFHIWYNYS